MWVRRENSPEELRAMVLGVYNRGRGVGTSRYYATARTAWALWRDGFATYLLRQDNPWTEGSESFEILRRRLRPRLSGHVEARSGRGFEDGVGDCYSSHSFASYAIDGVPGVVLMVEVAHETGFLQEEDQLDEWVKHLSSKVSFSVDGHFLVGDHWMPGTVYLDEHQSLTSMNYDVDPDAFWDRDRWSYRIDAISVDDFSRQLAEDDLLRSPELALEDAFEVLCRGATELWLNLPKNVFERRRPWVDISLPPRSYDDY